MTTHLILQQRFVWPEKTYERFGSTGEFVMRCEIRRLREAVVCDQRALYQYAFLDRAFRYICRTHAQIILSEMSDNLYSNEHLFSLDESPI